MTPEENRRGTIPQGIPLGSICIPQSENPQIGHLRTPELTMMIWEGNQPPRQINLASFQKNTLIIGRSPECDIALSPSWFLAGMRNLYLRPTAGPY